MLSVQQMTSDHCIPLPVHTPLSAEIHAPRFAVAFFLWVCMQHIHLHVHAERAQLCIGVISILLQAAGTDAA